MIKIGMCSLRALAFLLVLTVIQIEAGKWTDSSEYEEWQDFKDFQRWKHSKKHQEHKRVRNLNYDLEQFNTEGPDTVRNYQDPPPIDEAARMARYIVNQNNWTSIATISSISNVKSFPFVNVVSYADGPLSNGTGMPYLYITPLDYTAQDLAKDARATLSMTLAAGPYCAKESYDPMDPRCARVYLTGIIAAVKNNTAEFKIAQSAVFGRHPWLAHMPPNHHFFFVKIKILQIALLDTFGGPKYITPKEYFAADERPNIRQKYNENQIHNDDIEESDTDPLVGLV